MSQAGGLNSGGGGGGTNTIYNVSTFQPNVVLQEFDDFLNANPKLNWVTFTGAFNSAGTTDHPGIITFPADIGANNVFYLKATNASNVGVGSIALGGGTTTISWIVQLPTLSGAGNTYRYSCGLCDVTTMQNAVDTFVNGVYFQYSDTLNAGQWTINATNSSVTTTINTASVVTTSWTTLSIVSNANNTSCSFYVNNVLVGTAITTNLPTAAISPFFSAINTAGTTPPISADLFYIDIALTNPRPGPTFNTGGGGSGNLVLIQSQTASNSPELTFTSGFTGFDNLYLVHYGVVSASNDTSLLLNFSTDGGATYDTSADYYMGGFSSGAVIGLVPQNASGATAATLNTALGNGGPQAVGSGQSTIYGINSNTGDKNIISLGMANSATFGVLRSDIGVIYDNPTPVNAFRITLSAGNITSGTFKLYGIQN